MVFQGYQHTRGSLILVVRRFENKSVGVDGNARFVRVLDEQGGRIPVRFLSCDGKKIA